MSYSSPPAAWKPPFLASRIFGWLLCVIASDPLFVDCREAAMAAGLRSAFSVPVLDANGFCKGALASHFRETYAPTPYDLERQSLFAKLIAFALARNGSTLDMVGAAFAR